MPESLPSIRAAQLSDIPFLVWVMETAGRSGRNYGLIDTLVPESPQERHDLVAQLAVTEPRSLFHYRNFLVAEIDGVPVGGLSGYYTPEVHSEHYRAALKKVLDARGWPESRRAAMAERMTRFVSCFPGLLEEAWVVEWVAVKPEYRRRGIINALLRAIIEQGIHTTPCRVIQIAVLIGNTPAYNAYFKAGFTYFDEKCSPEFEREFQAKGMARLVIYPSRD